MKQQPRFIKILREIKRRDGACDRYGCVIDREQRGFTVLKASASYPGAELLVGVHALKLNVKAAKVAQR